MLENQNFPGREKTGAIFILPQKGLKKCFEPFFLIERSPKNVRDNFSAREYHQKVFAGIFFPERIIKKSRERFFIAKK
jgi:hypothetical protein